MEANGLEKLVAEAIALAVLRSGSVVVGRGDFVNAIEDVCKARGVRVEWDAVERLVERFRLFGDFVEEEMYVFLRNFDIKSAVDEEFLRAVRITDEEAFRESLERYLSWKLSGETEWWSSAKEALELAKLVGFEVSERPDLDEGGTGWVEYTVKTPVGEEFKIYKRLFRCPGSEHICAEYLWEPAV
jgi:hypothetical protein